MLTIGKYNLIGWTRVSIKFLLGKEINKSTSLFQFTYFRISILLFITLNGIYIYEECLPISSTGLKEGYSALIKHPFIISTSQYFGAIIAVIIAWHRSIVTDEQFKIQRSATLISNFLTLNKNCEQALNACHLKPYMSLDPNSNVNLLNNIFSNPKSGNFLLHPSFDLRFTEIYRCLNTAANNNEKPTIAAAAVIKVTAMNLGLLLHTSKDWETSIFQLAEITLDLSDIVREICDSLPVNTNFDINIYLSESSFTHHQNLIASVARKFKHDFREFQYYETKNIFRQ